MFSIQYQILNYDKFFLNKNQITYGKIVFIIVNNVFEFLKLSKTVENNFKNLFIEVKLNNFIIIVSLFTFFYILNSNFGFLMLLQLYIVHLIVWNYFFLPLLFCLALFCMLRCWIINRLVSVIILVHDIIFGKGKNWIIIL